MNKIKLSLKNKNKELAISNSGKIVNIAYETQYALGNYYELVADVYPVYVWAQLDSSLTPSLLYLTNKWTYKIPFNLEREWPYPTGAFIGRRHYAWARLATKDEINLRQNLAINMHDQHDFSNAYPHATANVETDDNSVFFARNAIDGIEANNHHGSYPFESWGIGGRSDAKIKIDFGRKVNVDEVKIILRADFPHDTNWDYATLTFSNGDNQDIFLKHTADQQSFEVKQRNISWIELSNLKCNPNNQGFTALTQIEAWGTNEE